MGGKTGVNHPLGKNMIGAFYQPRCVLIDTDSLNTLPDRELASGISGTQREARAWASLSSVCTAFVGRPGGYVSHRVVWGAGRAVTARS